MPADHDLSAAQNPFKLIDVGTGAVQTVLVPRNARVTIAHTGWQDDGSDSDPDTDYVVCMHQAASMAANKNEGAKLILFPGGGNGSVRGHTIQTGGDGDHELQLQAVGNGAKVQIVIEPRREGL